MKFKLKPLFKDISLTFITQAIVLVGFIYIYRLYTAKRKIMNLSVIGVYYEYTCSLRNCPLPK